MKPCKPIPWFKTLVNFILPIKKVERKRIALLLLLKFFISFVYCILTSLKDTTLVTAQHSAAEVIPIVKGYLIFPISIGIFMLYTYLNNHLKQSTLFYATILTFLGFILLYGFVLYPNAAKISPNATADWLNNYSNGKYIHFIAVLRHWIHVLFFITAELWGQIVIMVLYWTFVNNLYKINEAKRLYAILIAAGDLAIITSAPLILAYTKKYKHIDFILTVQALLGYVVILCLLIVATYWSVNRIRTEVSDGQQAAAPQKKLHLSFLESIKHISSSKHLIGIATMMIACGLSINLLEVTWKSYLKEAFSRSSDYQIFTSKINLWVGIIAFSLSFFASGGIIRKFGWKLTAQIAPITIGIGGCLFFLLSYSKHNMPHLTDWMGSKIILYIVFAGGIQSLLAKVVKYVFFDKTIQIAYIPLDPETKIKGKAAVDLLGSRLGKAGSSWIHTGLLFFSQTHSIQPASGILFIILFISAILWYHATTYVSKQLANFEEQEPE
ncbi:MAG: NTP/NDP exchange transporter [Amoebophilaceae bacterium]|nr:NTP/NDP exchange transporter [Amoebophilaceae bacterium]